MKGIAYNIKLKGSGFVRNLLDECPPPFTVLNNWIISNLCLYGKVCPN